MAARLEWLITSPTNEETAKKKSDAVEEIAADIVSVLRARGLTSGSWDYLDPRTGNHRADQGPGAPDAAHYGRMTIGE